MELKERIIEIINEISGYSVAEQEDINLFDEGILSSLAVMQMVGELDEAFDIDIDIDDVTYANFCSLASIISMVKKYVS